MVFPVVFIALVVTMVSGHSMMVDPRPTFPQACRLGGIPGNVRMGKCPGPCDLRDSDEHRRITNPNKPAVVWRRGQTVTIKYQRNNHGPGGFVRHSLVPISKMMDKEAHEKNAFHYGCWGANPVAAKPSELGRDQYGYSLVGSDGLVHNEAKSYFTTNITIPSVIPNGKYVLGWVWYGGVGGGFRGNTADSPVRRGHFSDYWTCSFVEIRGGSRLTSSYQPVFRNDLANLWPDGCNAQNDMPGVCKYEPCYARTTFQQPRPFKNGKTPPQLTRANFRGSDSPVPTPVPHIEVLDQALRDLYAFRDLPNRF